MGKSIIQTAKRVSYFDGRFYEAKLLPSGATRYLASVTTILGGGYPKSWIGNLRGSIGNREANLRMQEAMDRGSRVHNAIYIWAIGGVVLYEPEAWKTPDYELKEQNDLIRRQCRTEDIPFLTLRNQDEMRMVDRFVRWMQITKARILATELIVWDLERGYAGTLDFVLGMNAGVYPISGSKPVNIPIPGEWVLDAKTGAKSAEHPLQTGAYRRAYKKNSGAGHDQLAGTLVLYLNAATAGVLPGVSTTIRDPAQADNDALGFDHVHEIWKLENPNIEPKVEAFPSVLAREHVDDEQIRTGYQESVEVHQIFAGLSDATVKERLAKPEPKKEEGPKTEKPEKGTKDDSTKKG